MPMGRGGGEHGKIGDCEQSKKKHKSVRDNAERHYGKLSVGVDENMTAMLSKTSPINTCLGFVTDIDIISNKGLGFTEKAGF